MKSSGGLYFKNIDFLRGLAVLMVVCWHYIHPFIPYAATTYPVLDFFEEGHLGVGLFMVLSGFLFGYIVHGKKIDAVVFIYNRALRLAPLLIVVFVFWMIADRQSPFDLLIQLSTGFLDGGWPHGTWSISVELQFYLLFPVLLWSTRLKIERLAVVLVGLIAIRLAVFEWRGEVELISYWTLVGRADQLLAGLIVATWLKTREGPFMLPTKLIVGTLLVAFVLAVHIFNQLGGFYAMGEYPSRNGLWVIWPSVEAAGFSLMVVATFAFRFPINVFTRAIAFIGECSYSIYLLHFIFFMFIKPHVFMPYLLKHFPGAAWPIGVALSIPYLAVIIGLSWLSYRFIETQFLRFRRQYVIETR